MKCIKSKVDLALERGDIGSNLSCGYHPCHFKGQNCSFCYCPFFPCNDMDLGRSITSRSGSEVWDCSPCLFNHRNDVVKYSFERFKELGIKDAGDPRIRDVFLEAKERFFHRSRSLMILGTSSDAGKSFTATAICRILQRRGFLVTPFKSQNISLTSKVARPDCEIAAAQYLQSKAAGLSSPDHHINPLLLKPKKDQKVQVISEGRLVGDYSADEYYKEFVPREGIEAVRRNLDFLSARYDFMIIEGAGSPAEINIYDCDISNMRMAEMADADCFLIANMENGGAFASVAGTIALLPMNDRRKIKGIILNNVYGDTSDIRSGADELERITGIPVVGIIPHVDADLPREDSDTYGNNDTRGNGKKTVCVVRLPRIYNFTDFDPLILEDVTVRYVTSPEGLDDADAIILPGSNDTFGDLQWLKDTGLFDKIKSLKGKVPILGICGGYQMMVRTLYDPNDKDVPIEGLGLFGSTVRWDVFNKHVSVDSAVMNVGDGGQVDGYQLHVGYTENDIEKPLFMIRFLNRETPEGSVNEDMKLYGTFMHGIFERPAFRRYFMSLLGCGSESKDYGDHLDENMDRLADAFEKGLDDRFWKIVGVKQ